MKRGDIVVICKEQMCSSIGVVGEITFENGTHVDGREMYSVRYLSSQKGCAGVFFEDELRLASSKTKKRYSKEFIQKLFGDCNTYGCSDDCPHSLR